MAVRAGRRRRSRRIPARPRPDVPVMALGLGSNLIVRDGGVPGVVVRLGKAFAEDRAARRDQPALRRRGERHPGLVDRARRRHRRPRVPARNPRHGRRLRAHERRRLRPRSEGHPGFGDARAALGRGRGMAVREARLQLSPQRGARRRGRRQRRPSAGTPGDPTKIGAEMDRIAAARDEPQPIRSRTGGSTFKNPPGHKAWALIDAAGCRGMTLGRRASLGKALQFPAESR